MGKKRLRKKRMSKGQRTCTNMTRGSDPLQNHLNILDDWRAGKPVKMTVPNPDKTETNRLFIRVKAEDYLGPWKRK